MPGTALASGALIGERYRLDSPLGEGGMGTVWSAEHTVTRRAVAMKFLSDGVRNRAGLRQRFLREASAASALRHPHVVEILDVFDYEPESPVLVMELLSGETLGKKLAKDERMGIEETAALLLPVVSAVGAAHALGVVHRDLKPENIFLVRHGDDVCPKVLDFGIAKLSAELYLGGKGGDVLTDTGAMLGTPCYMAPEQATGDGALDHRADIWSLGVIWYECLSGVRPVEGDNLAQVVTRLVSAAIIPLERLAPELPHEVSATVMQMLSRDAARRPGLDAVALVLSRYTRFKVPPFGLPKLADGRERPLGEPRAKLANTVSADPQGRTMLSSPPVASSLSGHPATTADVGKTPRAFSSVLIVLVVLGIALALLFWPRPEAPSADATLASAAPARAVASAVLPPASSVAEASTPASAPASVGQAAPAPPKAVLPVRSRPQAAVARPAGPPSRVTETSHMDEESLFSGRK